MNMKRLIALCVFVFSIPFITVSAHSAPKAAQLKGVMKFISDAPLEKIVGTANGTGSLTVDTENIESLSGTITVPVASMKTGNDKRDNHLRGPNWLDEKSHPTITFSSNGVKVLGPVQTKGAIHAVKLEVQGNFTLHGVTKPITAPVDLKWKGQKIKLKTQFQIALGDFQVKGTEDVVGSKVGKTIDIKVRLRGLIAP